MPESQPRTPSFHCPHGPGMIIDEILIFLIMGDSSYFLQTGQILDTSFSKSNVSYILPI